MHCQLGGLGFEADYIVPQYLIIPSFCEKLAKGVRIQPSLPFIGQADDDSMQKYVNALDIYYNLMNLKVDNQQTCYAKVLLTNKVSTWFSTQGYDLKKLIWISLKVDLLAHFCPREYICQVCQQLLKTRQTRLVLLTTLKI